jgi:hypothetical protein
MVCCIGSSTSAGSSRSGSSGSYAGAQFAGIDGHEVRTWLSAMEQRGTTTTHCSFIAILVEFAFLLLLLVL